MNQRPINGLDDLMDGAVTERFNGEFQRVMRNVFDKNTSAKKKRNIILTFEITPNERRDMCDFKFDVKSNLAAPVAIAQTVFLSMNDAGDIIATEVTGQVPGQIDMEGEEVIPNVVDFQAKRTSSQ